MFDHPLQQWLFETAYFSCLVAAFIDCFFFRIYHWLILSIQYIEPHITIDFSGAACAGLICKIAPGTFPLSCLFLCLIGSEEKE